MINIAILGFGTVGSGVAEVLTMNRELLSEKAGQELQVKYILDTRDFPDSPFADHIIHDFSLIEQDPDVQVVVECIGGATVALDFVRRSLLAGKHVATSNKELVATNGFALNAIAKEKNVNFLFEASVGGGIPVLRPLYFDLAGNAIQQVCGILNGTTNYILTKMIREGAAFADVLKDAQATGYAEANPAADVEGLDACRKVCILSALAFGFHVYPDQVSTEGITSITEADVAVAAAANMKLKLLGRTMKLDDGRVCAFVAPHFVPADCQLAHVDDVFNGIGSRQRRGRSHVLRPRRGQAAHSQCCGSRCGGRCLACAAAPHAGLGRCPSRADGRRPDPAAALSGSHRCFAGTGGGRAG